MIILQVKDQNSILKVLIFLILVVFNSSCIEFTHQYKHLAPGKWRATLSLNDANSAPLTSSINEQKLSEIRSIQIDPVSSGELPFILDVKYINQDSFLIELINGEETIILDQIQFGRSYKTAKDTIEIYFSEYNSMIKAIVEDKIMEGVYTDFNRDQYNIPFVAMQGKDYRFTKLQKKPIIDLSGKWASTFDLDSEAPWHGEVQFKQKGNKLHATIATETGDFRYLSGTIQGNKLYLSTFDGSHAFLFEGKIDVDNNINGIFQSGKHYATYWKATRGEQDLKDPFSILNIDKNTKINIQKLLLDSFQISTSSIIPGTPTIIEIMGTWCPNCKDASLLLEELSAKHPNVQKIALAFEKKNLHNPELHLKKYQKKLNLSFPIIYAGEADKKWMASKLNFVSNIYSFPTFLFFNSDGTLIRSYSGFYGPATSQYGLQKENLDQTIGSLK